MGEKNDGLNIYYVCAGIVPYAADVIGGFTRYEYNAAVDIIAAPTRGKARAMMSGKYGVEFEAPMQIIKIGVSEKYEGSCFVDDDEWWGKVDWSKTKEPEEIYN